MNIYTVISEFTILPQGKLMSIGKTLTKYTQEFVVESDGVATNDASFWNWVGSDSSKGLMELTVIMPDSGNPLALIPLEGNYTTTDIVTTINNIINTMGGQS